MHDNIKKFTLEGQIRDDSDFIRLRSELEKNKIEEMRWMGYIPVLDIGSHWSTKRGDKKYDFVLTVYGVYVGKVKAWQWEGYSNGKPISFLGNKSK